MLADFTAADTWGEGRMTTQAARAWREALLFTLATDEQPEMVGSVIARGIERGAWRHFTDADGQPFETFTDFCQCPEPDGLGRHVDDVMAALERVLGKNGAKLATVRPARPGRRNDLTYGHRGRRLPTRTDQRHRVIDGGPLVVRDLFTRELIGVAEAAMVAARAEEPTTVALMCRIEAMAAEPEVKPKAARRCINKLVQQTLDPDKPLRTALAAFRKLTDVQKARFRTEIAKAPKRKGKSN